jgi:hypothetical protein
MQVGGKASLDHLPQLWGLQSGSVTAHQMPDKIDRYKERMSSEGPAEKVRPEMHQDKHKRYRMDTQAGATQNLRQGKALTGAAPPTLPSTRQMGAGNASLPTSAVPLQPLSKYRQVAQFDQAAEGMTHIVVTT